MTEVPRDRRRVVIHLTAQATVEFGADQLWPREGEYSRFGIDLASFALEVARRLHGDGYVGFAMGPDEISMIPMGAIKRIDFAEHG